jgi:hypothetical protein
MKQKVICINAYVYNPPRSTTHATPHLTSHSKQRFHQLEEKGKTSELIDRLAGLAKNLAECRSYLQDQSHEAEHFQTTIVVAITKVYGSQGRATPL